MMESAYQFLLSLLLFLLLQLFLLGLGQDTRSFRSAVRRLRFIIGGGGHNWASGSPAFPLGKNPLVFHVGLLCRLGLGARGIFAFDKVILNALLLAFFSVFAQSGHETPGGGLFLLGLISVGVGTIGGGRSNGSYALAELGFPIVITALPALLLRWHFD